jgi:hypothetical protein
MYASRRSPQIGLSRSASEIQSKDKTPRILFRVRGVFCFGTPDYFFFGGATMN